MSQTETSPIRVEKIAHIVLFVKDPELSAQWYSDILNMKIVARAADGPYKGGVFLSFGVSDHDIALFPAEEGATTGKEFEHVGLMMAGTSMDDLRRNYAFSRNVASRLPKSWTMGFRPGSISMIPTGTCWKCSASAFPRKPEPHRLN